MAVTYRVDPDWPGDSRALAAARDVRDLVDQALRICAIGAHFSPGSKNQEVVFLRLPQRIMDLFANQEQDTFAILLIIAVQPPHKNIVVGDNDRIQVSLEG